MGCRGLEELPKYSRLVSLELQKVKSQLVKIDKKKNIGGMFKSCEEKVRALCEVVDLCCIE